jgi:hypothetical protein
MQVDALVAQAGQRVSHRSAAIDLRRSPAIEVLEGNELEGATRRRVEALVVAATRPEERKGTSVGTRQTHPWHSRSQAQRVRMDAATGPKRASAVGLGAPCEFLGRACAGLQLLAEGELVAQPASLWTQAQRWSARRRYRGQRSGGARLPPEQLLTERRQLGASHRAMAAPGRPCGHRYHGGHPTVAVMVRPRSAGRRGDPTIGSSTAIQRRRSPSCSSSRRVRSSSRAS